MLTIMPVATGSLWGDLLAELKRALHARGAFEPAVARHRSRLVLPGRRAIRLEGRVARMIGLQALFGLLAVALAAGRLKAREKNPNWLDPTRGHRPRCGDDPIYWREYELPIRRGAGPLLAIRLRYVWILIRAILMNLLALLGALLAVAVPIGCWSRRCTIGFAAFQELWRHGYGVNGPFDAACTFQPAHSGGDGFAGTHARTGRVLSGHRTDHDRAGQEDVGRVPDDAPRAVRRSSGQRHVSPSTSSGSRRGRSRSSGRSGSPAAWCCRSGSRSRRPTCCW